MSGSNDDERRRLDKVYRDLPASELLRLYERRDGDLSETAMESLRAELRLRGLDPDSLKPTVPKARIDEEAGGGDASLADEESPREAPPRRGESAEGEGEGEGPEGGGEEPPPRPAPSDSRVRCSSCGAMNSALESDCQRCGNPLGEPERHQTMKRRITESGLNVQPAGTIASATTGIVGIGSLMVAAYAIANPWLSRPIALAALLSGVTNLGIAMILYRNAKKRREALAAAN